jgi:large subunit ribosomal protein L22
MSQESRCKVKFIRQSPYKVRFVLDAVRGKKVDNALSFLDFSNKKAAKFISKALNSALSNYAQKNDDFNSEALYVKEAYVDEGPKIKRFRPAAMGRASRILKRTSHLTVVIGEKG